MLVPLPRLTNSLRDHLDVDQEFLNRKTLLQSLRSRRHRDDHELARELVRDWDAVSSEVRETYKQYLGALVELMGGEVVHEELQDVAKSTYNLFSSSNGMEVDTNKMILEKKGELSKLVGGLVTDFNVHKVASLAMKLSALQSDYKNDALPMAKDSSESDVTEFGSNIVFNVPERFLIDIPLENGAFFDNEHPLSVSPLCEEKFAHPLPKTLSSTSVEVGTLRWLNDVCNHIVMGGTKLSGDELALTLCRILDSNKPGDEIAGDLLDLVGDGAFDTIQVLLKENYNGVLSEKVEFPVDKNCLDDPHVKENLLFQAHFSQIEMPIVDYVTDLKSVLDQSIRILQAMIDVSANSGWLSSTLTCMHLLQMIMQGLWFKEGSSLWMLPCMSDDLVAYLGKKGISSVQGLLGMSKRNLQTLLFDCPTPQLYQDLQLFPWIKLKLSLLKKDSGLLTLNIRMEKTNYKHTSRVFTPRFPKIKIEAWWLVLGNTTNSELYALKRVSFAEHLPTYMDLSPQLAINVKETKLFLISDCYLGLQQEHPLPDLV